MSSTSSYDWDWLRDLTIDQLPQLGISVVKSIPSRQARRLHAKALAFGFKQMAEHVATEQKPSQASVHSNTYAKGQGSMTF